MNFGKIAKRHAFKHGVATPITAENAGDLFGDGGRVTPKRLEKANARREALAEQLTKRWKLDEED